MNLSFNLTLLGQITGNKTIKSGVNNGARWIHTQIVDSVSVWEKARKNRFSDCRPSFSQSAVLQLFNRSYTTTYFMPLLNKIVMHRASSPKCTLRIEPSSWLEQQLQSQLCYYISLFLHILFFKTPKPHNSCCVPLMVTSIHSPHHHSCYFQYLTLHWSLCPWDPSVGRLVEPQLK